MSEKEMELARWIIDAACTMAIALESIKQAHLGMAGEELPDGPTAHLEFAAQLLQGKLDDLPAPSPDLARLFDDSSGAILEAAKRKRGSY